MSDKVILKGWKLWRGRILMLLIFFLLAEIILRIVGFKPGVYDEFYYFSGKIEHDPLMAADANGVSYYTGISNFYPDQHFNEQGYFGNVNFDKHSVDSLRNLGKKIVFLVGDSFTSGCCADTYAQTYANLLNESDEYEVLNFGVAGTDPLQYLLVVEKFAPILKPDLILVAVFTGNDVMVYDRKPHPFVPAVFPIKNGPWLNSEAPYYLTERDTYFSSFEEATDFYFTYFSLWSDEASFFQKSIRHSVIFSKLYFKYKIAKKNREMELAGLLYKTLEEPPFTYQNLKKIEGFGIENGIPTGFVLIPTAMEAQNKVDLKSEYGFLFQEIEWETRSDLTLKDYDGAGEGNHFNNEGHIKFAELLTNIVQSKLNLNLNK